MIEINLDESDFLEVATDSEKHELAGGEIRVLDNTKGNMTPDEIVEDLLPKALVKRLQGMMPSDFEVSGIKMQAKVSGKVFGSGISGSFEISFSKKTKD